MPVESMNPVGLGAHADHASVSSRVGGLPSSSSTRPDGGRGYPVPSDHGESDESVSDSGLNPAEDGHAPMAPDEMLKRSWIAKGGDEMETVLDMDGDPQVEDLIGFDPEECDSLPSGSSTDVVVRNGGTARRAIAPRWRHRHQPQSLDDQAGVSSQDPFYDRDFEAPQPRGPLPLWGLRERLVAAPLHERRGIVIGAMRKTVRNMYPKAGNRMMKTFETFDSDEILELLEDPTMLTLVCRRRTAETVDKGSRQNKSSRARGSRS